MPKTDWDEVTHQLLKRSGGYCECGCERRGGQFHHCIIHNLKDLKKNNNLDVVENLMLASSVCHVEEKKLDSDDAKQAFWKKQCDYYGEEHMLNWLDAIVYKVSKPFEPRRR